MKRGSVKSFVTCEQAAARMALGCDWRVHMHVFVPVVRRYEARHAKALRSGSARGAGICAVSPSALIDAERSFFLGLAQVQLVGMAMGYKEVCV